MDEFISFCFKEKRSEKICWLILYGKRYIKAKKKRRWKKYEDSSAMKEKEEEMKMVLNEPKRPKEATTIEAIETTTTQCLFSFFLL